MLEITLIILLAIFSLVLSISLFVGRYRRRGKVLFDEQTIDELIMAILNNARSGRLPDIAGRVANILKNHLKCNKIVFLKSNNNKMELSYSCGLSETNRNFIKSATILPPQSNLRNINELSPIENLREFFPEEYIKNIEQIGLMYFFPVFLRDNIYGICIIQTDLSRKNASLRLLTTALAFNLSTAYHIGLQDKRLRKYQNAIKSSGNISDDYSIFKPRQAKEFARFLKFKNCEQLIPELIKTFKKECNLLKAALYVKSGDSGETLITVNSQIRDNSDKILRECHDLLVDSINKDGVHKVDEISRWNTNLADRLGRVLHDDIECLASIPWPDRRRAIIAWQRNDHNKDISEQFRVFWKNAMPVIEHVRRFEKAEEMSYTDTLTGMYNLRFFRKRLEEELQRAKRFGRSVALLILDVDDLKTINDKYGHQAGDRLLKSFGCVLSESVRTIDIVTRYGGDEFCLIMPETSRNRARLFMERIRKRIATEHLLFEGTAEKIHFTVSIGGAVYPTDADSSQKLIRTADMALLRAKVEGRNCSKLYIPEYEINTEIN